MGHVEKLSTNWGDRGCVNGFIILYMLDICSVYALCSPEMTKGGNLPQYP